MHNNLPCPHNLFYTLFCFVYFFLEDTSSNAPGLLLPLHSGIIPGSALWTIRGSWDQNQIGCIKDKCSACSIIAQLPLYTFFIQFLTLVADWLALSCPS